VLSAERDRSSCHGLIHGARSRLELAANRRADEVRAVRVEALVDEQVDLAEIYQANVDRDLLALLDLGHALPLCPVTIRVPSVYHLYGWYQAVQPKSSTVRCALKELHPRLGLAIEKLVTCRAIPPSLDRRTACLVPKCFARDCMPGPPLRQQAKRAR
jgi:hypothetical protein